jgi:hypothetical protein
MESLSQTMKKLLIYCLLAGFVPMSSNAQLQSNDPRIVEVFGTYATQLRSEDLAWIQNELDRCEIRQLSFTSGEAYPKLSSVPLLDKYVPDIKMETVFDPHYLNPLKFQFDFTSRKDIVYRIDNTDYVIIIKKRK